MFGRGSFRWWLIAFLDPEASYTSSSPSSAAPLAVHSATSTLILPSSHPSSLQTYAPSTSTLIAELEVSPSNRVSRRDDIPIEPSRVEYSVVSSSGKWMATIDGRVGDDSFRGEVYLKIWWWDPKSGFWILNTRIDRPHGLERVTSIAFSPDVKNRLSLQLVTVGDDCTVRTWRLRTMTDKNSEIEGKSVLICASMERNLIICVSRRVLGGPFKFWLPRRTADTCLLVSRWLSILHSVWTLRRCV